MRRLFIVLAKLFGVYQVYAALVGFMQVCLIFISIVGIREADRFAGGASQYFPALAFALTYLLLALGMAWILLMRTDWLADKMDLKDDGIPEGGQEGALLRTGVKLIGLYVTVSALPAIVRLFLGPTLFSSNPPRLDFWSQGVPLIIQLALGLFLAIWADRALDLLTQWRKADSRKVILVWVVILVGLLLAGIFVNSLRTGRNVDSTSGSIIDRSSGEEDAYIARDTNTSSRSTWHDSEYWREQERLAATGTASEVIQVRM